jgi:chromate transporter
MKEILTASFKLGLTSFGGPSAHLGYFRNEYIIKRKWVDESTYADLMALFQFLPGPASSQVGISLGIIRGGLFGGFLAWLGFTLPSVLFLTLFAYLFSGVDLSEAGWIHGLKIAAVAVVAQAVFGMAKSLAPDRSRATILVVTAIISLLYPAVLNQILIIIASGIIGFFLFRKATAAEMGNRYVTISKRAGILAWVIFFALLFLLPIFKPFFTSTLYALFDSFYRVGSLVFGGGHVVLPLLEKEVVPPGWISEANFLAGYGLAQAVPGPLFTFASYLGTSIAGWSGTIVATVAIFFPSFLLVIGALPFWEMIRRKPKFQAALMGIHAAVVGILLAALYDPLWTSTILAPIDFVLLMVLLLLLHIWKVSQWIIVLLSALMGTAMNYLV